MTRPEVVEAAPPASSPPPELKRSEELEPVRREVRAGLDRVFSDVPARHGFFELQGGYSTTLGPYARAEAGYRVLEDLAAFGFGEVNRAGAVAGAGIRWQF